MYMSNNGVHVFLFPHILAKTYLLPFLFFFLAALRNLWDLGSLTKDQTCAPYSGSMES